MFKSDSKKEETWVHAIAVHNKHPPGMYRVISSHAMYSMDLVSIYYFMGLNLARETKIIKKKLTSLETFSVILLFSVHVPIFCFYGKTPGKIFQVVILKDKEEVK